MAEGPDVRILVFAPIGRDGPACVELLKRVGLKAEICKSLSALLTEAQTGTAAILIAEEGLFGNDLASLVSLIEAQPARSDLPIVVLTSHHEHAVLGAWRGALVSRLGNVSLLERPVQSITLTSTMQAAVRARLRQYEVRALLEAREEAAQKLESLVAARTEALQKAKTELETQMAEKARVEETLRQAQKMEAIGQLTGGVAHDFNNLLMVLQGGLDMLQRRIPELRQNQLVEGMRRAASRGAGLTRQLLAFSRRQPLRSEAVDLTQLLGGMTDLLDRSLRGDVHVELDFHEGIWPVEVDPTEFELVVLNLAVNARDAMPAGGSITVRAQNVPASQSPLPSDAVRLSIIDAGAGMSDDVRARAFEPFFTTKEIGKGSGLGLPQVYGFAQQSGGTVSIESKLGKGTTVTLHLPRSAKAPVADMEPLINLKSEQPKLKGRVLLVEDDDEVAALVSEMLDQLGYQVVQTKSAAAALGALANGRSIDIVFSDIMMPGGMNGLDLAREIRARRGLPVLLTSGYPEATKFKADAEGFRVLPKPYRIEELAAALRTAMKDGSPASLRS